MKQEREEIKMKKFEVGTYKTYAGTFEATYCIEKVTEKTVTVTIIKIASKSRL